MRVVSLDRPWKLLIRFRFFNFTLEYLRRLQSSEPLHAKMNPSPCLFVSWFAWKPLPIAWRTFIWWKNWPKCCTILVWIAGCWNSLLRSRNPKNNWCFSRIFGARFSGKVCGLSTCKPWSKQAGGWIHFCMKRLRTLNSFQIFKIKNKKWKTYVLFKAYPMVTLSCRSNLAGRYL